MFIQETKSIARQPVLGAIDVGLMFPTAYRTRIYLNDMQSYLPYSTNKSCKRWCQRMYVTLFTDPGTMRRFAMRSQFEDAYLSFLKLQTNNRQLVGVCVNSDKGESRVTMVDPMGEPFKYPKSKKWKGLYGYCNYCGYNLTDICKENQKSISSCPNKEKHIFRAYYHIPGTKHGKKSRKFFTRDVDEAIRLAMEFEKEVRSGDSVSAAPRFKNLLPENRNTSLTVESAIIGYLAWLDNKGVRSSMQRERSAEHKKDIARKLNFIKEALIAKGYDPSSMLVEELDAKVVDEIFDYFKEETTFSNNTFNKHFSHVSSLLQWVSNEHYPVRNWFAKVRKQHTQYRPKAISYEVNKWLLKIIREDNGIAEYHTGIKPERNFYRRYLKDAFRLALETGRRREEIINLNYNGIKEFPDGSAYIKIEDYKMNRIEGRTKEEEKKYHYVPITKSLRALINEMGYSKYQGSNKFILNPEGKEMRNRAMSDNLTRAFSHYYKQLGIKEKLTFKSFRKTYITNQAIYLRGSELASKIIGHTNQGTTNKHYIDPEVMARALKDFEVFAPEKAREEELQKFRNKQVRNNKQKLEK